MISMKKYSFLCLRENIYVFSTLQLFILMRKGIETMKPQKSIKIPLQFIKKIDKISLNEFRQVDLLSKRQSVVPKISLSQNARKSATSVINSSRNRREAYPSLICKPKSQSSLQKAPKIRFRATGAGFRQRKHESVKQEISQKNRIIFRKSPSKINRIQDLANHRNYEAFLLQQTVVKRQHNLQNQAKTNVVGPPRMLFGEKFQFKEEGEYLYQQKFMEQDFEWQGQSQSYNKIGFGVDSNLSYFDLQSLADPKGQKFISAFKGRQAFCPIFKNSNYEWIKVRVIDFDPKSHQALVYRMIFNDQKKVSTLSIRPSLERATDKDYWSRISSAKKLRKVCKEQEKYSRYIASRKEYFDMEEVVGLQFNQKYHEMIQKSWFNPYYRQFIIYKEMAVKPEKFQSMGLKIRTYRPFRQSCASASFQEFDLSREQVAGKHYSRFPKFPKTLYKLYERINKDSCNAIDTNLRMAKLEELQSLQCNLVKMTCSHISGKVREFLLSDILGELAFTFKSKLQQKKYIKLHNYIFKDLIIQNLYESNINKWTSFLSSFLTWSKATPASIIRMFLLVDKQAKCIQIQPSLQKTITALLRPLKILESQIESIPDILSELLGGESTKIKIKQSLIKESSSLIEKVALHSFQEINKYCNRFISKLKYLQKFKYERQAFTQEGRKSYEKYLEQLRNDMNEVNHSVIFRSGIFDVDPSNLKDSIKESIVKYKNRLGKLIQKQVEQQIESMSLRFKQQQQKLKQVPKDEEQLVKMREYLNNQCQVFLEEANQHYESCQSFYRLLEDHFIELNFAQFEKATEAIIKQYTFMELINSKFTQLNQIEQEMLEAINDERDIILKGLQDMGPQIDIISNYSSLSQLSEYYVFTSRTFHDLQNFQKQLANINYRESVLGQEISIFPVISKLQRELRPYFDVWNNAYNLVNLVELIKTDSICNLKFDELKHQISQFAKEMQRLSSYFTAIKNPSALWVIESLNEKVIFAQDKLWIIRSFTLEGMLKKQGIRKEVLTTIFKQKEIKFHQLTLETFLEEKVEDYKDFVIQNAEKAERIWKLQIKIAGIVNQVKKLEFQFEKQLQVPFVEQRILLSLSCAVHQQLSIMSGIKDLEEASYIQKKVNNIFNKLTTIQQTLLSMISFQETFFPQLHLLKIQEIAREMGKQMNMFADVQRIWKSMCSHFMKDHQVWQAIQTDSYKNRLQNLSKMMVQIDKRLNQVIDNKRQSFPRLFFLSPAKMRALLLNENLITSSAYLPYLFNGVKDFLVKSDRIRGIIGWDNQEITFKKNFSQSIVWEYLKCVEEETGKIIQWELNFKSNKNQKYIFSKGIKIICDWTYFIQQAISSKNLKGLLQKLNKDLEANKCIKKIQSIIYNSYLIMLRDTISSLHRKNVNELSNFEWKKTVKYYMTEGGGVQAKMLNFGLPFREEYTGNLVRPLACLSDQSAVQIINLSWHMNTGLIIQRNATETIRQICGLTLRHYVEQTINFQTNPQELLYLLRGYLCSDIWMSITQSTAITKNIFEIIAQTAFEVHSVIESGRSLFYLGGEPFNLPKAFKFNLFIGIYLQETQNQIRFSNFEENRLESINTKFGVVFRAINWILPSQSMVCRFKLESLGISQKQIDQIMKLYEFFILEIKQQWFYKAFDKIIDQLSHKLFNSQGSTLEIILNFWKRNLSLKQIEQLVSFVKDIKTQQSSLSQVIGYIQESGKSQKSRVLLVGDHLSGKDHYLKEIFRQKNIEIKERIQYNEKQHYNWLYISIDFYYNVIPLQQKLIVKASKTSFLDPKDISSFIIYYHETTVNWLKIAEHQCNISKKHLSIKEQAIRQMKILFNQSPQLPVKGNMNIVQNSFTLSFFKFITIFCQKNKIENINIIQKVQFVFMILFWQSFLFFPNHSLKPKDFGSTFTKQPLSYYYDLQKSAWLQWTTLSLNYFSKYEEKIAEIYLPTKETVSFIYFFTSLTSRSNIWIEAQSSGIGLHKILKRAINKGLLQFYKAHKDANFEGISNLVSHNIAIFKKQGKYFPKLGQNLIICIEDVNLPRNSDFNSFISALLNYSFQKVKKRLLANSTFICTNSNKDYNKDVYITSAKNLVRIKALSPSQQSIQSIFNYYLQWFFGDTQNPFSKQVRNASQIIVNLSSFIIEQSKVSYSNIIKCSHIVKVFEGLCQCSPKTVKSTKDILQLWLYECKSAFENQHFTVKDSNILDLCIQKFLSVKYMMISSNQMNIFKEIYQSSKQYFLKLPSLKAQYSETYRKVDIFYLHQHITELIEKIDYKLFSYFPLIIFESLLDQIIKIIRILNIPNRNILIYGGKGSGKTTLARIASFIYCEGDAEVIQSVFGWKHNLGKTLSAIKSKNKHQCLIFRLQNEQQEQFMTAIQELLYLNHPQSLLFDKNAGFLQNIGISSTSSEQYASFQNHLFKFLHCCITLPSHDLNIISSKYPYFFRRVQLLNIHTSYLNNGPKQIAKASIGKYFHNYSMLAQVNKILIEQGIEMNQGKFMKLSQIALQNYQKCITFVENQRARIERAIKKIRKTQHQKKQLEKQLQKTNRILEKLIIKVEQLRKDYKQFQGQYQEKVKDYNENYEQCQIQRGKTDTIRKEVDFQLSKVLPMLKAAEEAMAKVTRDDINQLRSFPSPPLPAAKVVQSLIFLFNQSHLVKEKVLDGGQKVRDFWEYAKKMILNDKLLKRVSEYKPDTIKDLDKMVVLTLKQIIKKPQFIQQRVFKASVAAGNLSLWIKAILAVYDVMTVIEPKKKLLNESQQALSIREFHLKNQLQELNKFHTTLMQKKRYYQLKLQEKQKVVDRIHDLQHFIANGKEILQLLYVREKEWINKSEVKLKELLESSKQQSIFAAVYFGFLTVLQAQVKGRIIKRLQKICAFSNHFKIKKYQYTSFAHYQQKFMKSIEQLKEDRIIVPFTANFYESLLWIHELISIEQKNILIVDKSFMLMSYLNHETIASSYEFHPNVIDCLTIKKFQDLLEKDIKNNNEVRQDQQEDFVEQKTTKQILILLNIEHRPQFLLRIRQIFLKYYFLQIIIVQNQETIEFTKMMQRQRMKANCKIENSLQLKSYIFKEIFELPTQQIQQLNRNITETTMTNKLIDLLCQTDNIILSEDQFDEWIALNKEEADFKRKNPQFKKIGRVQQQKIQQNIHIFDEIKTIKIPKMIQMVREHLNEGQQGAQKSLWTLVDWLKAKLSKWPQSLIKVIATDYENFNALGYYLLKFKNKMVQLQNHKQKEPKLKDSKQIQQNKIASLQCEVIDPASLVHSLRRNQTAFICLTDKYKLKKSLEECKQIEERYKTEYLQEFLERQEFHYIYLISQCGTFLSEEIVQLKQEEFQDVITHIGFDSSMNFKEAYQVERVHRRYDSLIAKEKKYIRTNLFNRPLIRPLISHKLYELLQKAKIDLQKQKKVIVGVFEAQKGKISYGNKQYDLKVDESEIQLTYWQLEQEIIRLHSNN